MTAFGIQFETLAGAQELAISNLITVAAPQAGFNPTGSDSIQIWNATESKFVTYYNRKNVGWCKKDTSKVTTDTVKEGDGVYFKRNGSVSDTTITVAGKVNVSDPAYPISVIKSKMTFLCNPWPVDFAITNLHAMVAAPQAGFNPTGSDSIQVWDSANSKYVTYYDRKNVGYCLKDKSTRTTDTIAPGVAFMFKRNGSATDTTINFTKPSGL